MSLPSRRSFSASVLTLLGLGLVWALHVGSQTAPDQQIFGPKQYLRTTGPPNQYTDTFTVPASIGAPFKVHIVNGDAKGKHRISSGTITLNGVVIVRPRDFSRGHDEEEDDDDDDDDDAEDAVGVIDKSVTLQPKNTLQVKLEGKRGSFLTISVFGTTIGGANQAPTANPGGPYSGNVGQPIQFNGTKSSDPENNPLTFTWNFGDGATGTGSTPNHTYSAPGAYTVSLTVDDGHGHTKTTTTVARILSPLTEARLSHSATLLPGGKVLLAGGTGPTGVLNTAEVFDPVTLSATALTGTLTTARTEHTATLLPQTETLLIAGQDHLGLLFSTEMFNPDTQSFQALSPTVQVLRSGHTATGLLDGRVLITGGQSTGALGFPATETFSTLANALTTPRAGHTATLLPDGRVLMLGGEGLSGVLASAEVFSPSTTSFSAVTPGLATARVDHTATLLPTGLVLITGGRNSAGILASTELYSLTPADTMSPMVNQVSPPSSATGVDQTEIIGVRFSEPVDVRTLTSASVTLTSGGAVAATLSPGEQGLMLFVVPSAPLAAGTTYTLSLTSNIKDTAGKPLTAFASQFTTVAAPTITSFTPNNGPPGTTVTITGTNFDPDARKNEVKFNGVTATVTSASATSLTAIAPSGATTGPISVTTRGGTATSATNFTVINPTPTVTSFTPTSGKAGDQITITGTNFINVTAVTFNGSFATTFSVASETSIVATVPTNVTTGPIRVTTTFGTATSAGSFVVIPTQDFQLSALPGVTGVPAVGSAAFSIGLTGSGGFTNLTTLTVAGVPTGVTATFSAATLTAGQSTFLTITTTGTTPAGTFQLTVTATGLVNGASTSRSASVTVQVLGAGVTSLAGQVLDEDAKPVKGAVVKLGPLNAPTAQTGDRSEHSWLPDDDSGRRNHHGLGRAAEHAGLGAAGAD